MNWDQEIDASGLLCPLPVLKIGKRLRELPQGTVLRARTDDPAALVDVPHFCAEQGHTLLDRQEDGFPAQIWLIRRGA
ncbi:MAG: sulfurtransferase TusA family protein [Pseudomonadota bacterium]